MELWAPAAVGEVFPPADGFLNMECEWCMYHCWCLQESRACMLAVALAKKSGQCFTPVRKYSPVCACRHARSRDIHACVLGMHVLRSDCKASIRCGCNHAVYDLHTLLLLLPSPPAVIEGGKDALEVWEAVVEVRAEKQYMYL